MNVTRYTYAEFKRLLVEEPWQWNPEMLPKMRKHPFLGWLGNRAMALWAERGAEHYNKKVAACADYRRDVLSLMEDDPRWQQLAVASADVIDTLGMTEDFNANLTECYDKGVWGVCRQDGSLLH
jgi:hypothetical protein